METSFSAGSVVGSVGVADGGQAPSGLPVWEHCEFEGVGMRVGCCRKEEGRSAVSGGLVEVVRMCTTLMTSHGLDSTSPLSGHDKVSGRRMTTTMMRRMMTTMMMMMMRRRRRTASAEMDEIVRIERPEFVQYIHTYIIIPHTQNETCNTP